MSSQLKQKHANKKRKQFNLDKSDLVAKFGGAIYHRAVEMRCGNVYQVKSRTVT